MITNHPSLISIMVVNKEVFVSASPGDSDIDNAIALKLIGIIEEVLKKESTKSESVATKDNVIDFSNITKH